MNISKILADIGFDEFISFDLETTGLDSNNNEIIEIAAVKFKGGEYHSEFSTLVKPKIEIPKSITKITNITNSMVSNAPFIEEVLDDFINFVNHGNLIAHNIDFDLGFINKALNDAGKNISFNSTSDTLSLARSFLFHFDKFNLEYLSAYFSLNHDNAHRATPDAINTGKIFVFIVEHMISLPTSIFANINNICKNRESHNIFLYKTIHKLLIDNSNLEIPSRIDLFFDKDNVIENTNGDVKYFDQSINSWFKSDGILSKKWKDYSYREVQDLFSLDIYENFCSESILLTEAGAGLGKSLAYLVASIKYAKEHNKKIIISTYTKTLQEQLFYKDIPSLISSLNLNVKAIILKGKNNYISKNKLNKIILKDHIYMTDKDINECITLLVWSHYTKTGDIEECNGLNKSDLSSIWSKLSYSDFDNSSLDNLMSSDNLNNDYYHKIIKQMDNCDILVVNHSLLCTDMIANNSILPKNSLLIIDEGHNFTNSMKNALTSTVSNTSFLKLVNSINPLIDSLPTNNCINLKKMIVQTVDDSSKMFDYFMSNFDDVYDNLSFGQVDQLINYKEFELNGLDIDQILKNLNEITDEIDLILESNKKKLFFLQLMQAQLKDVISIFKKIIDKDLGLIRWVSFSKYNQKSNFKINVLEADFEKFVKDVLFKNYKSFLMCSATFTINNSFDYFFTKLPLKCDENFNVKTSVYKSPFFYDEQAKYYFFNKTIDINSSEYINEVASQISRMNKYLRKRILVLCTSYKQVNAISNSLSNSFSIDKNEILSQTSKFSKQKLLEKYISSKSNILVATSTFWEGVDLPGNLLEILFILRIPFGNPSNPYNSYFSTKIESSGGNSFYDIQLPESILRLKQGVGRLIRSDKDSGVCFLTDPRLSNSRYGKYIIDELTPKPEFYTHFDEIINDVDNFLG